MSIKQVLFFTAFAALATAGPVEFGQQELRAAMSERGSNWNLETEINLEQPETYKITQVGSSTLRISGGDLRGLMYGLMEAADQLRNTGALSSRIGGPAFAVRGVQIAPTDTDPRPARLLSIRPLD
ncbi:MAG: hypothetical protein WDO18_16065 [Acidobacteriota bacterium]